LAKTSKFSFHKTRCTSLQNPRIVGGALFAVATVIREAVRLADENAGFV
jgi:hypothetical protein